MIDRIVAEPLGGAHRDPEAAIGALKGAIIEELDGCGELGPDELLRAAARQVPRHRLNRRTGTRLVISRSKSADDIRRRAKRKRVMRRAILLLAARRGRRSRQPLPRRLRYLNPRDVAEAQRAACRESSRNSAAPRPDLARLMSKSIGRRVGAMSGVANPGQTLHFTTLNSAVENALSVPGGYVYITRQLMGAHGR